MWQISRQLKFCGNHASFIGGKPRLPLGFSIPTCRICNQRQTFMFQIALPIEHAWGGKTVACYACMKCANEDYLIPEMLSQPGKGCNIPEGFLTGYQRNFKFVVFQTDEAHGVENYPEEVEFEALDIVVGQISDCIGQIGGEPTWLLDDESPATYHSTVPMTFLLQLSPGIKFKKLASALPQTELDIFGTPSPSPLSYYQLFLGNALYLFGTVEGEPLIYVVTQC